MLDRHRYASLSAGAMSYLLLVLHQKFGFESTGEQFGGAGGS